jgi:F0F1-type ATP synthase epsilon subunit
MENKNDNDLRVVIRTLSEHLLDTYASELEVEDNLGRFTVTADGDPALAALVPSEITLRKRDGGEIRVRVGWGTLTAAGGQARLVVHDADVTVVEPMRIAV